MWVFFSPIFIKHFGPLFCESHIYVSEHIELGACPLLQVNLNTFDHCSTVFANEQAKQQQKRIVGRIATLKPC